MCVSLMGQWCCVGVTSGFCGGFLFFWILHHLSLTCLLGVEVMTKSFILKEAFISENTSGLVTYVDFQIGQFSFSWYLCIPIYLVNIYILNTYFHALTTAEF